MAGLSHTPEALNCAKYAQAEGDTGRADTSAVCLYCEKNSPELMERLAPPAGPDEAPAPSLPPIGAFFERIGIVKGAPLHELRTVDGQAFFDVEVAGLAVIGAEPPFEAVLTLREPGVARQWHVAWSHVCSYR